MPKVHPKAADNSMEFLRVNDGNANRIIVAYNMQESPSMANLRNSEHNFDEGIEMDNRNYISNKKPFVAR